MPLRPIPTAVLAAVCLAAPAAAADPITETCLAYAGAEICNCATERLAESMSPADLAFYGGASGEALMLQADGAALVDAWEEPTRNSAAAAGISRSDARDALNAAGSAHRDAIAACGG